MHVSLRLTIAGCLGAALAAPFAVAQIPQIPQETGPQPREQPREQPTRPEPTPGSQPQASGDPRFTCEQVSGNDTVMYRPQSQPGEAYAWVTPTAMGSSWSSDRRCREIARRLESYRPDGLLELANGFENNYDTVCVTTERDPSCRIVLTVPPGEDPQIVRDRTFQNIVIADSGTQTQPVSAFTDNGLGGWPGGTWDGLGNVGLGNGDLGSGDFGAIVGNILGGNQAGSTLRILDSSDRIDLRPFLEAADGGSGAMLSSGRSLSLEGLAKPSSEPESDSNRLDPNSFR